MESVTTRTEWESPEFEEIGCAPEVTMYVARMDD
ncbi:MAG TPA: pyrroloquinoline quinone precursor peptide PqqA [Pseudonocardia sp.]